MQSKSATGRVVEVVSARRELTADPAYEVDLAADLKRRCEPHEVLTQFQRFSASTAWLDSMLRRACLRALVRRRGIGIQVGINVSLRHPDTFEFGDGVLIGDQVVLLGRHDGTSTVGDRVWIGPQCFLDAHDLVIEDYAGVGPGVRILGSQHTGQPIHVPIVTTDLVIRPVRVAANADIGTGAVLLPGVTIVAGAMIGAGAVVTHDIPENAIAVGVPARVTRLREDEAQQGETHDR
jgi:acetyltransferase-like isoleucine patch superfamily enzyme